MGDISPRSPRRFLPQPVETSSRSSRSPAVHQQPPEAAGPAVISTLRAHDSSPKRPAPSSSHPSSQHAKRFLPQPVETTTRSSKDRAAHGDPAAEVSRPGSSVNTASSPSTATQKDAPARRRFLPQPVETGTRSSKQARGDQTDGPSRGPLGGSSPDSTSSKRLIRRFAPEPIETVKATNRKLAPGRSSTLRITSSTSSGSSTPTSPPQSSPRKFTPQLIETGKRSVRRSGTIAIDRGFERYPSDDIFGRGDRVGQSQESRFSYASLLRRQERQHSFRVPDLPSIPSTNGDSDSDTPSLSNSPITSAEESRRPSKISDHRRESCDERVSGYLLELAARSAEKQLKETALAAFPNEQVYQPPSHFAIEREEDDSTVSEEDVDVVLRNMKNGLAAFRRESTSDLPWELDQLRRFKEEAQKKKNKKDWPKEKNLGESRFSAAAIAARRALEPDATSNILRGWQKELEALKKHSPPMLGADLVFPRSLSPQSTRCDVDYPPGTHHDELKGCTQCGGLWSTSSDTDDHRDGGLWMGTCKRDGASGASSPTPSVPGIRTPARGEEPYYASLDMAVIYGRPSQLPTMPKMINPNLADMERKLSVEEEIDREFDDGFVTQVYNYLSLGYPCLARYFDAELSKITGIPVHDLRQDDQHTDAKGYVGAPEGTGADTNGVTGGKCMRWTALRLYIREWARQQPRMSGDDQHLDAWGVRERRGSWAF